MHKKFWDEIFHRYNQEIFDVRKNDKGKIIESSLSELASGDKIIGDIGCGVGKWLTLLSPMYKKVVAIDFSKPYVEYSKEKYQSLGNIDFLTIDLSTTENKKLKFDVILCVNVIISPSASTRKNILKGLHKHLVKGGSLILVVPSLESALYAEFVFNEWTNGNTGAVTPQNILLDKVPTKHYLEEELVYLMQDFNFEVQKIKKVEYVWSTEFADLPKRFKVNSPWDWMVVATKK